MVFRRLHAFERIVVNDKREDSNSEIAFVARG